MIYSSKFYWVKEGTIGLMIVLFVLGCKSAPKQYGDLNEGNWRARALIKDVESSRSYIVNLDFNLVKDQRVRVDVTTAIGSGVASLLSDQTEVRYILLDDRKFYSGPAQESSMRPILAIPFDPRWLQNLFFDEPITGVGWSCTRDSEQLLSECRNPKSGLVVSWSDRHGDKKTIRLVHAKASVQIKVLSFKPKVEERPNLFTLEAPEGFKKLRVR